MKTHSQRTSRRWVAVLLSIALCFGMFSVVLSASAAEEPTPNFTVEGETLTAAVTAGSAAAQDLSGLSTTTWSGNAMLTWSNPTEGSTMSVEVEVPLEGNYALEFVFGASFDYGITDVSLDGNLILENVDTYRDTWAVPVRKKIFNQYLTAGKHTVVFTHAGQNAASQGATIGFDCINFSEHCDDMMVEGESLVGTATASSGTIQKFDLPMFREGSFLFWRDNAQNDTMTFSVSIPNTGLYDVTAALVCAGDYGNADIAIDGVEILSGLDCYSAGVESRAHTADNVSLTAGEHIVTVTCVGKNDASAGTFLGLDYIDFIYKSSGGEEPLPTDVLFEGESLTATVSAGAAIPQDLSPISTEEWSQNSHLFWSDLDETSEDIQPGDTLSVEIELPYAALYYPVFALTTAPDYGIFDIEVDGITVLQDVDCYGGVLSKKFSGNAMELSAGKHTVCFTIVGNNDSATDCFFGLDFIQFLLQPLPEDELPAAFFYEGEDVVRYITTTGGTVGALDLSWLSTTTWSNNSIAAWEKADFSDELSVDLNLPSGGIFDVEIQLGTSWDYGMVDVYLDNTYLGFYDCYAPSWNSPVLVTMEDLALAKGKHTLSFTHMGKNDDSDGTTIGLDYIRFTEQAVFPEPSLSYLGSDLSAEVTGGEVAHNNDLLTWLGAATGDALTFDVYLPEANYYTLNAKLCIGINNGAAALSVDGKVLIENMDCFGSSADEERKAFESGQVYIEGGFHTVTLTLIEKNALSGGNSLALESLDFTPDPSFVSYPDIVNKLLDMEQIALLEPGENSDEFTSYDRSSKYDESTDSYVGWDANVDGSGYLYETEDNGRVIAEMDGPGYISHIFIGTDLIGDLVIYIDGQEALRAPFIDLVSGKLIRYPALAYKREDRSCNLYIPITYNESCKVVMYPSSDTAWQELYLNYYTIDYTTLPSSYEVENFTYPLNEVNDAALEYVNDVWSGKKALQPAGEDQTKTLAAEAGQTIDLHTAEGANAVSRMAFRLADEGVDLSKLVMRMYWDGSQTASAVVTLADYFAECYKTVEYASYISGCDKDGTLWSNWFMPYANGCRITLENRTDSDISLNFTVRTASLRYDIEKYGRFCVNWQQLKDRALGEDRKVDSNFLTLKGSGRYVGSVLHVFQNIQGIWWGEGDVKVFVDEEKFPSWYGTGSEDYFGYAWSTQYIFNKALHGQPLSEGGITTQQGQEGMSGNTINYRWHMSDSIPFSTSFDGNIEKYFSEPAVYQAWTSFYYLDADDLQNNPAREFTAQERNFNVSLMTTPTNFYDETHLVLSADCSGGKLEIQGSLPIGDGDPDSNHGQLWWKDAAVGDTLSIKLNLPQSATGTLIIPMTCAADYGKVRVLLDGQEVVSEFNGYVTGVSQKVLTLNDLSLGAGEHTLTFEIIGKDDASTGYMVGVDYVKFIPEEELDFVYGDINADGQINASDALLALQHSVQLTVLEREKAAAADVNSDGKINATDALYILQYSVKLIDHLPVV